MRHFTYLIAHAGSQELFEACTNAINKYTPGEILLCSKDHKRIWGEAFMWLFEKCPTDVGVFIDDDCILTNSIQDIIEVVASGNAYMAAIDGEPLNRGAGYYQPNLMVLDIARFKKDFGINGIYVDKKQYKEDTGKDTNDFFLGISQKLREEHVISLTPKTGVWPLSSDIYLGNTKIATHLWYGAWAHRKNKVVDGVNLEVREKEFINNL